MSVTYKVYKTENDPYPSNNQGAACFNPHYQNLWTYHSMEVFVHKDWMQENKRHGYKDFTKEDYEEYARLLQVMGLNFSMRQEGNNFVFFVPLKENTTVHNKLILNAVRYLCEDNMPHIAQHFLRFAKEKVLGVNLYTKFLVAHQFGQISNNNHAFIPYYSLPLPLSNEDFKEKMLDSKSVSPVLSVIPQCKKPYMGNDGRNHADLLRAMVKEGYSFKKCYEKYKELCDQFM